MNSQELIAKHTKRGKLLSPIVLCDGEFCYGVVIAPSAKNEGKIQASYFSTTSLFDIDQQHTSVSEAVETVVRQGYTEDGNDLLEAVMSCAATVKH